MSLQTKRKLSHAKSKALGRTNLVVGTFDEDNDVLGYARAVRREYAEMEEGHYAARAEPVALAEKLLEGIVRKRAATPNRVS